MIGELTPMVGDVVKYKHGISLNYGFVTDVYHNGRTCNVYWFVTQREGRYETRDIFVIQRSRY